MEDVEEMVMQDAGQQSLVDEVLTAERAGLELQQETFDLAPAAEQMRAIDHALRVYFDTDHWLRERDERMPALRRRW